MNVAALRVAIGTSMVASTILALVLLVLWRGTENRRALGHWALAYAFNTLRFASQLLAPADSLIGSLLSDLSLLGFITFLWTGMRVYNDEPVRKALVAALWLVLGSWVVFAGQMGYQNPWRSLPHYTVAAVMLAWVGVNFLRRFRGDARSVAGNGAYLLLGILLILRGVHVMDYPFLRGIAWFAPFGFGIGATLDYATGITLLVAILGEERRQAAALADDLRLALERSSAVERALIDRETRLERVLDLASNAIAVISLDTGRVVEVNAGWTDVFGSSAEQACGRTLAELRIHADPADEQRLQASAEASGGVVRGVRAEMARRDGKPFPAELSATTFESGGRRFLLMVARDISIDLSLAQTQQHLREREEFFSLVFQLIPDTLTVVRVSDGKYVEVNRNWHTLLGYTRAETLGRSTLELGIWADPEERDRLVAALLQHSELRDVVLHLRHRDGRRLPVRASLSVFEAGGERFYLFAGNDIADILAAEEARREAEQRLKESEYKFASMFQLAPLPLALTHLVSGEIADVNDVWLSEFGRGREQTVGRTLVQLNLLMDPGALSNLMTTLDRAGRVEGVDVRVRADPGRILECVASARVIVLGGQQMCIFSLVDFTAQRDAESEVRRLNVELEERVAARTRRLEEANFELADALDSLKRVQSELIRSEKMAALGSLVAGIAHELNTPIGNGFIVSTTLQEQATLMSELAKADRLKRSELNQFIEQVTSGTGLLLRTLGTARDLIRNFKQVAVDQASSQRREFDLKAVLEEVAATLLPMYRKGPIKFSLDVPDGISMDSWPGPLGQVITNFTSNALSHAFEGRDRGNMRLSAYQVDESIVEIRFSDDGSGVAPANRTRIFDPFFTTKLGRGGSGLGMHIVYNIVTSVLGGSVTMETEVGRGTTFIVRIPRVAPEAPPASLRPDDVSLNA